jgi:hypothetical protein
MIKAIGAAIRHPTNRALPDFQRYWAESHGTVWAYVDAPQPRRYVQHVTLPEAYEGEPKPTHDGASMFWYDDLDALRTPVNTPEAQALREAIGADDRQLFDRQPGWPAHHKRASVVANERVVVDGAKTPEMVKGVFILSRMPGLTHQEFFEHWYEVHGPLAAKLPGLRRYVQNHAILELYGARPMTHDGWPSCGSTTWSRCGARLPHRRRRRCGRIRTRCSPVRRASSSRGNDCRKGTSWAGGTTRPSR